MKLRVGIVGLGPNWESRHRPALRALSDRFDVRTVCCSVYARAEQAARDVGGVAVDGIRAVVERPDIDAILCLTPEWFGTAPILAACEQGKAVYACLELQTDLAETEAIRNRVERAGIAFMSEFPRRHAAATLRLKELIATRLGRPKLVFCHARTLTERGRPGVVNPWTADQSMTRQLMEQVDWCRYVIGDEPTSVMAVRHLSDRGLADEDYQMMSLDFSPEGGSGEGPVAQISCGRYMPHVWHEAINFRPPAALQVCCENGIAFVDLPHTLVWFDQAGQHLENLDRDRSIGEMLMMSFHRAVTSLVRRVGDIEDAFRAISIVETAHRAAVEGQRMPLTAASREPDPKADRTC